MKKYRGWLILLALVLVLTSFVGACTKEETPAPAPAPAQPIVMRCASEFAPPELISVILQELVTTIPQQTAGRVKFEYYPAAQLYTFPDAVAAMQAGDLEMGINGMPISFLVPEWDIICSLPFLVEDGAHLQRLSDTTAYKDLSARMEAMGIKPLTKVYPMDVQPLFNRKRPIATLEDLRGLKLSVGPGPTFLEAMTILSGSKPVNIPIPEVPASLETGMVDGSPFPWPVQVYIEFPRLMPYVTLDPCGLSFPVGLVVSTKWWKTLPSDLQQTLQGIFETAMDRYGKEIVAVGEEQKKVFTNTPGTTVTKLTAAERARWLGALKPLYDKMRQNANLLAIMQAADATRK